MTDNKEHRENLLFEVRRSIRYHNERRRFFARLHTIFVSGTLLLGAATAYSSQFATVVRFIMPAMGLTITCLAILDLVFRLSDRVVQHHDLARRFYELRRSITVVEDPSDKDLSRWRSKRLEIEEDEPPVLRVLNAMMYNRTLISMGRDSRYKLKIRPFQKFFAQYGDIKPDSIIPPTIN